MKKMLHFKMKSAPFFFTANLSSEIITLDEETSKHIVQVLRMEQGEQIRLTDGMGNSGIAEVTDAHKKRCTVRLVNNEFQPPTSRQLTIAISLIKNSARFEWFLEKATELGTAEIIPLICERTSSEKFRMDRYRGICRSAMLQSMQTWMPVLHEPVRFADLIAAAGHHQRFIAHCEEDEKHQLSSAYDPMLDSHIILIGPEGDFTMREIIDARNNGFMPVSLGSTRLRSETAGIYAAVVGNSLH